MIEKRFNLNGMTVGELKKILKDIDDSIEIEIYNEGTSGVLTGPTTLEVNEYEYIKPNIYINVVADSGYY